MSRVPDRSAPGVSRCSASRPGFGTSARPRQEVPVLLATDRLVPRLWALFSAPITAPGRGRACPAICPRAIIQELARRVAKCDRGAPAEGRDLPRAEMQWESGERSAFLREACVGDE